MLNIKDIDNLINVLTEVKKEKEEKQLELLQESIKQELIREIEDTLIHFESDSVVKFLEENDKAIAFDYDFNAIMESVKEKVAVDVWEVE